MNQIISLIHSGFSMNMDSMFLSIKGFHEVSWMSFYDMKTQD